MHSQITIEIIGNIVEGQPSKMTSHSPSLEGKISREDPRESYTHLVYLELVVGLNKMPNVKYLASGTIISAEWKHNFWDKRINFPPSWPTCDPVPSLPYSGYWMIELVTLSNNIQSSKLSMRKNYFKKQTGVRQLLCNIECQKKRESLIFKGNSYNTESVMNITQYRT